LLFALWKKVILCGTGSMMIPLDHSQTIATGIEIT